MRSAEWGFYREGPPETGAGLDYSAGAIAKVQSQAQPKAIAGNCGQFSWRFGPSPLH